MLFFGWTVVPECQPRRLTQNRRVTRPLSTARLSEQVLEINSDPSKFNERRSRVLFVNRSYWPDAEATGQLLTELCEDLTPQFDVTVLAGQPNQNPKNEVFSRSQKENRNGVTIERVRHPRFAKRSLFGRAINLIGFLIAATVRALKFLKPRFGIRRYKGI